MTQISEVTLEDISKMTEAEIFQLRQALQQRECVLEDEREAEFDKQRYKLSVKVEYTIQAAPVEYDCETLEELIEFFELNWEEFAPYGTKAKVTYKAPQLKKFVKPKA
jgi:hypothetical protein